MHLSHKVLCIRPIYMNESSGLYNYIELYEILIICRVNQTKKQCFQTYFRGHDRKYENNFFFFIKLLQNPNFA